MTPTPELSAAIRELAAEFGRLSRDVEQIKAGQRSPQLDFASIENGAVTINDDAGNPQLQIGLQQDGTFAHVAVAATMPGAPSPPVVAAAISGLYVIWDGLMADGSQPLSDFDRIQVHVSALAGFTPDGTTLQGYMDHSGMFTVGSLTPGQPCYIVLVPLNTAQQMGPPSSQVTATPLAVPDSILPGALTGALLDDGTVTGSKIADDTITAGNIAAGTITANEIAAQTIAAVNIAAGTVIAGIVNGTTITGAKFICQDLILDIITTISDGIIAFTSGAAGTLITTRGVVAGIDATHPSDTPAITIQAPSVSGGSPATLQVTGDSSDGTVKAAVATGDRMNVGGTLTALSNIQAQSGTAANPTLITTDSTHALGTLGQTGISITVQSYTLLPDGHVMLSVKGVTTNTATKTAGSAAFPNTMPAIYRPATTTWLAGFDAQQQVWGLEAGTGGLVLLFWPALSTTNRSFCIQGIFDTQ